MHKFQNKYRVSSAQAQWWDYGVSAGYFITICTRNRTHFFGEIKNKIMCLSEIGRLAYQYWMEIPRYFGFVILDEFVVMPANQSPGQKRFHNPGKGTVSSIIGSYKSIVSKKIPFDPVGI